MAMGLPGLVGSVVCAFSLGETQKGAKIWHAMLRMSTEAFEAVVEKAIADIPDDLLEAIDNVAVVVEDEPSREDLIALDMDPDNDLLFGLYEGVSLGERGAGYGGVLPDRVVIYRLPLLEACESRRELLYEIRATVIHEIGHYFGFDEEDLP
jgi:predicted Zn-dependent protease with MMP-like domain